MNDFKRKSDKLGTFIIDKKLVPNQNVVEI